MNNVSIEQFTKWFFPYLRLLTGSEFLYLSYIANLGKSRISKKIENLIETFLIRLIPCITITVVRELTYIQLVIAMAMVESVTVNSFYIP